MRLFVAADLPDAPRSALRDHGRALAAAGGWRAVPDVSLHVTLAFLGERPDEDPPRIAAALASSVVACGEVTLGAPVLLPRRAPRVAAVELVDPGGGLARLQASVAGALAVLGVYRPERRPFLAHVTVARRTREPGRPGQAADPDFTAVGAFHVPAVTLYRSKLSRAGAAYEALARVEVPRAADGARGGPDR